MPKGRHLKVEFWTDKNIVQLSPLARLLYLGLWNYAADCGHLDDEPLELKMRLLPADNCDVDALLAELVWHRRIERNEGVLHLPKLAEHQKPDKRWFTLCDACKTAKEAESTLNTTSPQGDHVEATTGPQGDHVADVDVDVDVELMVSEGAPEATSTTTNKAAARKRPAKPLAEDWRPTSEHHKRCLTLGIDPQRELAKFRAHAEANDRRQVNWNAAFTQWLLSARPTGNVRPIRPEPDEQGRVALPPLPKSFFDQ